MKSHWLNRLLLAASMASACVILPRVAQAEIWTAPFGNANTVIVAGRKYGESNAKAYIAAFRLSAWADPNTRCAAGNYALKTTGNMSGLTAALGVYTGGGDDLFQELPPGSIFNPCGTYILTGPLARNGYSLGFFGKAGADFMYLYEGGVLNGGDGDDYLYAHSSFKVMLQGGDGEDWLLGCGSMTTETYSGGADNDCCLDENGAHGSRTGCDNTACDCADLPPVIFPFPP